MAKTLKIVIIGCSICMLGIHCKRKSNPFDEMEKETLEDKIIWSDNKKLRWTDYKYDSTQTSFTIYTKVGLSVRYNVERPILFRSHTTFSTTESTVSDTTHLDDLRIGQAKFDLLETYRRKMEEEVDSIRNFENPNITKEVFDNMVARFYNEFEDEWDSFRPITLESLKEVEAAIKRRLN
ncbi:hypothetical protein J0X14_15230 [Muricauda sp. CAU 1633]|uniref:hypothetical protein n=1 Tax=Allomuricauda sp. CAU 1633 TaxID=2816036 RepID=UPI001A8DD903|nr:hypothetical protein [Muricauda sp. CAU 1633]MBO0323661.1 hypothetical protein [Muricauda sp. CAU 1633]